MLFRAGSAIMLTAASMMAGCAQQSSAPPMANTPVTTAAPAQATATMPAGSFDGNYGNRELASGIGRACGTTRFGYRLTVKDGQASMRSATAGMLEGPVGPDGTVQIRSGGAVLDGKITGNKFAGHLTFPSAQRNLRLPP